MRTLIVGATGVLGRPLVPLLAASGHEVLAASRSARPGSVDGLPNTTRVRLDLLDVDAVHRVVDQHRPDAIVHVATAIPDPIDPRRIGEQFGPTNRLRTEGTANLVAAAEATGVSRIVAEGLAYAYQQGDAIRTEDAALWVNPPKVFAPVMEALRELEIRTRDAGGTVLRFGHLYGPGTIYAPEGSMTESVRARKVPIVGRGASRFSFVHVEDAATAILAALDRPVTGTFNVVDDDPLRLSEWLPWFADLLGARRPPRFPAAVARLAVGPFGVTFMNGLAGASNARAKDALRWQPRFRTFRDGVTADFVSVAPVAAR
ncbi:NAD-dependent epimerase/dehydratase family protein [Nitriliruptor alkaliphilus]|uniref:NAD-dependent epimerase/dehydratase family protein n=1 Tax=Nitriliruptor alkaliphilus TaxID=427918 RepID=UPI0006987026|nr:NAD(P)-dependent oxidoreductase [Nitriliruptor alkaliphilus]